MSDTHTHESPNYMAIFWWLAVLTAAEVGVTFLKIPKLAMGVLLVGMAFSKAVLVAMYFMHLKFEKRTLGLIALIPLAICILLTFALLPDAKWIWRPN